MKLNKKFFVFLITIVLSLIMTFVFFEQLSWYHFGDTPTDSVLYRLIIFFIIIAMAIFSVIYLLTKIGQRKNR